MSEKILVNRIVQAIKVQGYIIAMEVADLYRSADIAFIDNADNVCVIECKISSMSLAINQSRIHKISADKVYVGTYYKNTRAETFNMFEKEGIGLIYVMPDGSINKVIEYKNKLKPFEPTHNILRKRILEASNV